MSNSPPNVAGFRHPTTTMNPITAWIAGNMEDPAKREEAFESRMQRQIENCAQVKADWSAPRHASSKAREFATPNTPVPFTGGYLAPRTRPSGSSMEKANSVDAGITFCEEQEKKN